MTPYETVIDGLSRIAALDPDSPAADAVRDEMDATWHRLTEDEKAAAGRYSESLYEREALHRPRPSGNMHP